MSDSNKIMLLEKIIINGKINVLTGLHIGGTNNGMDIGGVDSAVIRNPVNKEPYIPGSSLKGKMRSLLELAMNSYKEGLRMGKVKNGPGDNPKDITTQLFGSAIGDDFQRPSKIIVRDGKLIKDGNQSDNFKALQEVQFAETKTEVVIDRITAAAMPRQMERVPSGAQFSLEIVLNIFSGDDKTALLNTLFRGLMMVQDDYLGGNGSRGSGQVSFQIDSVKEKNFQFYLNEGGEESNQPVVYQGGTLGMVVPSELRPA